MSPPARLADCLLDPADPEAATAYPLTPLRPQSLPAFLEAHPEAAYLRRLGFTARAGELVVGPADQGLFAVLGLGEDFSPFAYGGLAAALPEGSAWRLAMPHPPSQPKPSQPKEESEQESATLGFVLGAYHYEEFMKPRRRPARLVLPDPLPEAALAAAEATFLARDLINAPANLLGPAELAAAALRLAAEFGAAAALTEGPPLAARYPAIAAVGAGSARPPVVAYLAWTGSGAAPDAPLLALCGKGVCFDTGGLDLKPSGGMLRMKKDMGGAAMTLALARLVMEAELPIRLSVRLGCVENSVSAAAMRPLDVIHTRHGLTVEVGNTDAEGRLVLCDLLAEAAAERPALLLDFATLTGAARAALGPDLPALFCSDDPWAERLLAAGRAVHDPLWRLPLWDGYASWLESPVADLNTVSSKPHAGAVVAALFLRRFVAASVPWAHIDLYAWNDETSPGRPRGGEAQAVRACFAAVAQHFA
jgi:leucyl aminopeptidase